MKPRTILQVPIASALAAVFGPLSATSAQPTAPVGGAFELIETAEEIPEVTR